MIFLKCDCRRMPHRDWHCSCLQDRFRNLSWIFKLNFFIFSLTTDARGSVRSQLDVERSVARLLRVDPEPSFSFQRIIVFPLDKPGCFGGK